MTTTTNYLTQKQFRDAKSRLTRAINSGDNARVIAVVDETFDEWDAGNFAWPDDWHRWEQARFDAELRIHLAGRLMSSGVLS
jgi:hypothetical protein